MHKLADRFTVNDLGLNDISPIRAGYQSCSPEYSFGPIVRDIWIIQYVYSGYGTLIKNGNVFRVEPTYCFVIRPGEETQLIADTIDPWVYIWVGFKANTPLPQILNEKDVFQGKNLEDLFLSIANCNDSANRPLELLLLSQIWRLIFELNRINIIKKNTHIDRACAYIENEYATITVSELAARLSLDRCYFSKLFRHSSFMSPQEYINTIRLKKSRELLIKGHSVSQVAIMVGYLSTASYSRAFKNYYKYSPKHYLNSNTDNNIP
ncbi:MAG: AraC family transcriptional regulator [Lachnospiraceae bacterium]|nr:AraC family transcriptional regulator [Lachnospiraceae bacterium]